MTRKEVLSMPWWLFRRRTRSTSGAPAPAQPSSSGWHSGEVALPHLPGSRRSLPEQPALHGNYLAPIEQPRRILDVGCGTGQWAFELARQFPHAEVIGLDLEQVKATQPPPNYRFIQGDVLKGLPFEDNSFDFVHQRLLVGAIPLAAWPGVVQELARVTSPGGWIELVELSTHISNLIPSGPTNQQLASLTGQLIALRGLDSEGIAIRSLDRYLEQAGLVNVQRHSIEAPLGEWGGRIGALLA